MPCPPSRPPSHPPAPHAAWALGGREGARVVHPPRSSPSTTAATVESSSQLFLRKRFQSHPFFAGFPMAGARAPNHRRGGRSCAWGSAVRAGAGGARGPPAAPRLSAGGMRARWGEGVRWPLPQPLSPPPPPPELARRACSPC